MNPREINEKVVEIVASGLKDLLPNFVFVGGAVIVFYIDDPAADEIRTTGDIDMTIQLANYSEWAKIQNKLAQLGFNPNPEGHSICSYTYKGIFVDIMPSDESILGNTNSWYKPGFDYIQEINIGETTIKVFQIPYFLATKFEAFNSRGRDYRTSHDFEDIIYVIDNCTTIVNDINNSDSKVKSFIIAELSKILSNRNRDEIISSQIHPRMIDERLPMVLEKINQIVNIK